MASTTCQRSLCKNSCLERSKEKYLFSPKSKKNYSRVLFQYLFIFNCVLANLGCAVGLSATSSTQLRRTNTSEKLIRNKNTVLLYIRAFFSITVIFQSILDHLKNSLGLKQRSI